MTDLNVFQEKHFLAWIQTYKSNIILVSEQGVQRMKTFVSSPGFQDHKFSHYMPINMFKNLTFIFIWLSSYRMYYVLWYCSSVCPSINCVCNNSNFQNHIIFGHRIYCDISNTAAHWILNNFPLVAYRHFFAVSDCSYYIIYHIEGLLVSPMR